jgi:hypothetical protein
MKMELLSRFILPGILLLITFAFGCWMSRLGKPYNGILFNIHKLAALGAVVLAGIQTYNLLKGASAQGIIVALAAMCVLCVIALFATGAFMSIGNPLAGSGQALPHAPLLTVHKIALTILPFASAGMVYLLSGSIR